VKITQRQSTIGILMLQAALALLMFVSLLFSNATLSTKLATGGGGLLMIGLLAAYLRGWDGARYAAIIITTLLAALAVPEPYLTEQVAFSILVPPVLALILATPVWVVGSTIVILAGLIVRAGGQGVYTDPATLLGVATVVVGMILSRLIADTAQRAANEHAQRAEQERVRAEQRATELDEASKLLEAELDRQRSLLTLVETLETPVVRLADSVLFAPVVGHMDTRRSDALMRRLLETVHTQRARMLIIDIAGVAMVDTAVAAAIARTVQGLRMLGCEVVISGISAPVASSLVQLGASLGDIRTVRSPEEALALTVVQN
jgi:rsbT co-antagonist protein RsbR